MHICTGHMRQENIYGYLASKGKEKGHSKTFFRAKSKVILKTRRNLCSVDFVGVEREINK